VSNKKAGFFLCGLVIFSLLLSGCATQKNIPLDTAYLHANAQKMIVVREAAPKPRLYKAGGQGLLDMAISYEVTKNFGDHIAKVDLGWYEQLQKNFVNRLHKQHIDARLVQTPLALDQFPANGSNSSQYSTKNFSALASQLDADSMLIFRINYLGAIRNYYGFVPLDAPQAYCVLTGELINLADNRVYWRQNVSVTTPVQSNWDQPPNYPNFDATLNRAVTMAQQGILDSFFNSK
jgi:hypothetical protein